MSIEFIDPNLCNGCGICVTTCLADVIRLDTLAVGKKEYPPCRLACPAGVDMRSYLYLLRIGMMEEAIKVLREALPIPAVTGRVCPHPCESECARKEVDEAVNINALERFAADYWITEKAEPVEQKHAEKTAVIGSGPAGLSCAYFLAKAGYPVTVFEAMSAPGGMLRLGIPEYRLPREILDAQIDYIRDMGVTFRMGVAVGRDVKLEELQGDYRALFFAIGSQLSAELELEGAELDGVLGGLEFLRDVNLKKRTAVAERVVVIGGGNVAIDAARTCRRLGAKKVDILYRRRREDMSAAEDEIRQALEEGVSIKERQEPKRLIGDGRRVTGVEFISKVAGGRKDSGTIAADMVILAVGQKPDLSLFPRGIELTEASTVRVDPLTLETNLPGVFAGGDVTGDSSSVVEAIAAGKKAAVSIMRYLQGEDLRKERQPRVMRVGKTPKEGITPMARQSMPLLLAEQRTSNLREVARGFNQDMADLEAQRCMTCGSQAVIKYVDDCMLCLSCERDCPVNAIYVSPEKKVEPMLAWG